MSLRIVPVTVAEARRFVDDHHRHHFTPASQRFVLGAAEGTTLVGVAIVGSATARGHAAEGYTVKLTRTATDGSRNANSMLEAAAWRAARALGW
ncbi:XF1762 family protein, partial [Burkholderia pseudomallei]|uniref:XF1762 family protein n=1 Tax=Burkholderia pseudomallei TaxID=28450 RepID=UPI00358F8059